MGTHSGLKELLVFQHPSAGLQLPAGTVEDGEEPAVAVVREVVEETGILDAEIVRLLDIEVTLLPNHQRAVRNPSRLLAEPRSDAATVEMVGRSGFLLDVGELDGLFRQVTHRDYEFVEGVFVPVRSVDGWMLDEELARRIVRHHYELRTPSPTQDRWAHSAEGEFDCELYWTEIREDIGLVASNQAWLRFVIDKLRQSGADTHVHYASGTIARTDL
jgi:8-oxo-dGTP pyrophosphatase MutT (NUDIX family)